MVEHTDLEYKDATDIAYLTFLEESRAYLGPNNEPYTIKELVENYIDLDSARRIRSIANPGVIYGYEDEITELKSLIEYADIPSSYKDTLSHISNDTYSWKYLTGRDHSTETGFYGCLLETNEGDCIASFRGSESYNYKEFKHDWINADFKLLAGETVQDLEAKSFAANEVNSYLKEHPEYKSIDVTGHSLGGHLATEFTIYCAEENRELYDKIGKCVNLDGPGRDASYYKSHEVGIGIAQEKIKLYKASMVGEMLYSSAITDHIKYVKVKTSEEVANEQGISNSLGHRVGYDTGMRHLTKNWVFDEEGNIVEGEPSQFAVFVGDLSRTIDESCLEDPTMSFINWLQDDILTEGENGEIALTEYGKEVIKNTGIALLSHITSFAIKHPLAASMILSMILGVIVYSLAEAFWEKHGDKIMLTITNDFKKVFTDFKTNIERFESNVLSIWNYTKDTLKVVTTPGRLYSNSNPNIKVDTDILRECAEMLDNINQRIQIIDQKIDRVYADVGLFDMLNLTIADIKIGYDHKLKKCYNYLINTADTFEQAENNITKVFE